MTTGMVVDVWRDNNLRLIVSDVVMWRNVYVIPVMAHGYQPPALALISHLA